MIMNSSVVNIQPEIQEYLDFLNKTESTSFRTVKKERILKNLNKYGNVINTFLTYPDILADIMTPKDVNFSMFFAQRMVLRSMARSRQSYFTFARGFSKSFLADFSSYTNTMLVPRHKSFVTAGTKQQAAQIAKEKVIDDLWNRFPLLKTEMSHKIRTAGKLRDPWTLGQDYAEFRFSHGGVFDIIGGNPRGLRRNSGIFEEVIQLEEIFINEQVIPLLNKPREDAFGRVNPLEPHGNKIFITTAGYMGTFAYNKLLETLCHTAVSPDKYMVLGGSYKIPVMHGLLEEQTVRELMSSPSYSKDSFDREFNSIWSGAQKGSVFSANTIASLRKVVRAEYAAVEAVGEDPHFYVVSADMAKDGSANTVIIVLKVKPKEFYFNYSVVNLFKVDTTDYEKISNVFKRTVIAYDARLLVYDANGIGAAMRDWLNKDSQDENGIILNGLGIINPPTGTEKDVIRWPKNRTICYEIKATGSKAEQIHQLFFSRISNGAVRFLIKSSDAVSRFSKLAGFKKASNTLKERRLRPYLFMDQMEVELNNLEIQNTSDNLTQTMKIKRRDNRVQKDFFSAVEYGLYAVHTEFEMEFYKRKRKAGTSKKATDWVFID